MTGHATGYTVGAALELARAMKNGPLPALTAPMPTPDEALEIIREERRTCGFTWITGEIAMAVIGAYMAGGKAGRDAVSPYADWSDEHRAWQEGQTVQK